MKKFTLLLLLISFVIFIHEFGHYTMYQVYDVPVDEFSIGMGPKIYSYKTNQTKFSLRLLPLGGYCKALKFDKDKLSTFSQIHIASMGIQFNLAIAFIISIIFQIKPKTSDRVKKRLNKLPKSMGYVTEVFLATFGIALITPIIFIVTLNKILKQVAGPIQLFKYLSQMIKTKSDYVKAFVSVNVLLAGFQLIPIFPLDGGNILNAIIASFNNDASLVYQLVSLASFALIIGVVIFKDIGSFSNDKNDT